MGISPLTAESVTAFLALPKRATIDANGPQLHWEPSGLDAAVAVLTLQSEEAVAAVRLVAGYDSWRHWTLILSLGTEQIYSWHFKENGVHANTGCPSGFPRKAPNPHEHLWVPGHDLSCARALQDFAQERPSDLKTCFEAF